VTVGNSEKPKKLLRPRGESGLNLVISSDDQSKARRKALPIPPAGPGHQSGDQDSSAGGDLVQVQGCFEIDFQVSLFAGTILTTEYSRHDPHCCLGPFSL